MKNGKQHRLKNILRHINNVQQSCCILGEKLIEENIETDLGIKLIANGFIHDNSKFYGIEFKYLHDDVKEENPQLFNLAMCHHQQINMHHPEYWNGIENMPRVYIAEMVCDIHARSNEFGTNIKEWIKNTATERYKFSVKGSVYKEIKYFLDLLLSPAFD